MFRFEALHSLTSAHSFLSNSSREVRPLQKLATNPSTLTTFSSRKLNGTALPQSSEAIYFQKMLDKSLLTENLTILAFLHPSTVSIFCTDYARRGAWGLSQGTWGMRQRIPWTG